MMCYGNYTTFPRHCQGIASNICRMTWVQLRYHYDWSRRTTNKEKGTTTTIRLHYDVPRRQYEGFCDLCDAIDIDTMIHVVTWYKQEVNKVLEQEVNLVLVDVLPVSC